MAKLICGLHGAKGAHALLPLLVATFFAFLPDFVQGSAQSEETIAFSTLLSQRTAESEKSLTAQQPATSYKLTHLIERIKQENLDLRINAEKLFRAHKQIRVKMGSLLPHLSLWHLPTFLDGDFYAAAASFLGFLYPTNWFRWQESMLFFEAERYSHAALMADLVNAVTVMYYDISYIGHLLTIYDDCLNKLEAVVQTAKDRHRLGEDGIEPLYKVRGVRDLARKDMREVEASFRQLYVNLGAAVNDPHPAYTTIDVKQLRLPDLSAKHLFSPADVRRMFAKASKRSFENQSLDMLILASKYSRRARYFAFLDPSGNDGDSSFGFGYTSYIKVGKSESDELRLKRQKMDMQIGVALQSAAAGYNTALSNYTLLAKGLKHAEQWYAHLQTKFAEADDFDADQLSEAITNLLSYRSSLSASQHQALLSHATIDRLLLHGQGYKNILDLSPQRPQGALSLLAKIENKFIQHAIKKGEFELRPGGASPLAGG